MIFIGIDFSLNSSAICFNIDNKKFLFYNIYRIHEKLTKREQVVLDILKTCPSIEIEHTYSQSEPLNYNEKEHFHLQEAMLLENKIINKINKVVKRKKKDTYIVLEGFSYGSDGNRLAELSGAQYLLRSRLVKEGYKFIILSPKTIKKTAGNGNFDKKQSIEAFLLDDRMVNNDFRELITNNLPVLLYKNKEFEKPIDDFVDAYWGMCTIESHIENFGD